MLKHRMLIKQASQRKQINTSTVHIVRQSDFHKRKVVDQTWNNVFPAHICYTESFDLHMYAYGFYMSWSSDRRRSTGAQEFRSPASIAECGAVGRTERRRCSSFASLFSFCWQMTGIPGLFIPVFSRKAEKNMFQETLNTCKPPLLRSKWNIY